LSKEMSFLEHIDEFRSRLLCIIVTIVAIALLSFLFCIKRFRLWNASVCLPYPDPFDIASILIRRVQGLSSRVRDADCHVSWASNHRSTLRLNVPWYSAWNALIVYHIFVHASFLQSIGPIRQEERFSESAIYSHIQSRICPPCSLENKYPWHNY
jgi:hypothetical protein